MLQRCYVSLVNRINSVLYALYASYAYTFCYIQLYTLYRGGGAAGAAG